RAVAQLDLLVAPDPADAPVGLRVETSLDGRAWTTAADLPIVMPGVHWWKGHPRVDESGRVLVRPPPRPTRDVRSTHRGDGGGGAGSGRAAPPLRPGPRRRRLDVGPRRDGGPGPARSGLAGGGALGRARRGRAAGILALGAGGSGGRSPT